MWGEHMAAPWSSAAAGGRQEPGQRVDFASIFLFPVANDLRAGCVPHGNIRGAGQAYARAGHPLRRFLEDLGSLLSRQPVPLPSGTREEILLRARRAWAAEVDDLLQRGHRGEALAPLADAAELRGALRRWHRLAAAGGRAEAGRLLRLRVTARRPLPGRRDPLQRAVGRAQGAALAAQVVDSLHDGVLVTVAGGRATADCLVATDADPASLRTLLERGLAEALPVGWEVEVGVHVLPPELGEALAALAEDEPGAGAEPTLRVVALPDPSPWAASPARSRVDPAPLDRPGAPRASRRGTPPLVVVPAQRDPSAWS